MVIRLANVVERAGGRAGGQAGVNNSSVRNSSYNFQRISTKLSHNYCNQVPQRIFWFFFDSIIFYGITALCFFCTLCNIQRIFLLCATPPTFFNGFQPNFHTTIVIVGVFRFDHFSRNYGPLFLLHICNIQRIFLLCATPPTFFNGFQPNFHTTIVIKCPSAYCRFFSIRSFFTELWPFVSFAHM